MGQLISEIWAGLRDAGLAEVMLYLPDNSASRCHWDDTALIGDVRVALLADQDRQIVRILPVDSCVGIGIASPKGTDPSGYKRVVFNKLTGAVDEPVRAPEEAPAPPPVAPPPPPPPPEPVPVTKVDPLTSRWGTALKTPAAPARYGGSSFGGR